MTRKRLKKESVEEARAQIKITTILILVVIACVLLYLVLAGGHY